MAFQRWFFFLKNYARFLYGMRAILSQNEWWDCIYAHFWTHQLIDLLSPTVLDGKNDRGHAKKNKGIWSQDVIIQATNRRRMDGISIQFIFCGEKNIEREKEEHVSFPEARFRSLNRSRNGPFNDFSSRPLKQAFRILPRTGTEQTSRALKDILQRYIKLSNVCSYSSVKSRELARKIQINSRLTTLSQDRRGDPDIFPILIRTKITVAKMIG